MLGMPSSYYTAKLINGWRLIALDTTEMSGHSCMPEVRQTLYLLCSPQRPSYLGPWDHHSPTAAA